MRKISVLGILMVMVLTSALQAAPNIFWESVQMLGNTEESYTFAVKKDGSQKYVEVEGYNSGVVGKIYNREAYGEAVFRVLRGEKTKVTSSLKKNGVTCFWEVRGDNIGGMLITTKVGKKMAKIYIDPEVALDFQIATESNTH